MNKKSDISYGDVAQKAREEAASFSETVIGEKPTYRSGGEIRFFANQSLRVYISGPKKGRYQSFTDAGAYGDMIDLTRYIKGMDKSEAFEEAKRILNITEGELSTLNLKPQKSAEELAKEELESQEKKKRIAQWIWKNSSTTQGKEAGEIYLRKARGLKGPFDPNLIRFRELSKDDLRKMNVDEAHIPEGQVTAVIFKATNAKGELCSVQQVLTCNGEKITKTIPDFDTPKKTNGLLTGSAVKFGGERPEIVILAEGPETALSLFESTGIPTWITLGTSNYTTLQLPTSVKEVIIAADMEPSGVGLGAALRAAQHWMRVGVPKVGIALPRTEDGDFNDILKTKGAKAVATMVEKRFYGAPLRAPDSVVVTACPRSAFHIWEKVGVETRVRVPGKAQNGERFPIMAETMIEPRHKNVVIIEREGFSVKTEQLQKDNPDVKINILADNNTMFLSKAKNPGYVEKIISDAVDFYTPGGRGETEPVAFCLRRADADALHKANHKAIAVRATALDIIDLSFMNGRKAYICPVGTGTEEDTILEGKLKENGAQTTRILWQLFRPEGEGYRLARKDIPSTYGAADAVQEGWKGEKMAHLLRISQITEEQLRPKIAVKEKDAER